MQTFGGKVTSVSLNIKFYAKMSILCKKKLKFWEKFWVSTTIKSDHLFAKHAYLKKKCDVFCEGLYTVTNCLVLVKKKTSISYDILNCMW